MHFAIMSIKDKIENIIKSFKKIGGNKKIISLYNYIFLRIAKISFTVFSTSSIAITLTGV